MDKEGKKAIIISLILSVIVHFMLYGVASKMGVLEVPDQTVQQEQDEEIDLDIQDAELKPLEDERKSPKFKATVKRLPGEKSLPKALRPGALPGPKLSSLTLKTLKFSDKADKRPVLQPPKTIEMIRRHKMTLQKVKTSSESPSLSHAGFAIDPKLSSPGGNLQGEILMTLKRPGLSINAPSFRNSSLGKISQSRETKKSINVVRDKNEEKILDQMLDIQTFSYQDVQTGRNYFRLDIKPNTKTQELKTLPKDILFLIDSSRSISVFKLREFVRGVHQAIYKLNPQDRFNVVTFKTENKLCFNDFQSVTPENLERADTFLKKIKRSGKTDIYAALKPFVVNQKREGKRPKIIFIASDGETTTRKGLKPAELIAKISQENSADISISTFSCGSDINSFVINFLAYKNRGYHRMLKKAKGAHQNFDQYIQKISRILVSDLEYYVDKKLNSEVYPQKLPHLYQDQTLSLYGSCPISAKEAFVRVSGLGINGQEELIHKIDLAQSQRGERDIAINWAQQKVYHLLTSRDNDNRDKVMESIQQLKHDFKLVIPYK